MDSTRFLFELPLYLIVFALIVIALVFPVFSFITLSSIFVLYKFYSLLEYYARIKLASHLATRQFKVAIIGSGFGGILAGIECKKRGIPFVIYEKTDRVGGTWAYNQYPGCACDVAAHIYSYSFEPYDWTRKFSPQPEIQKYLEHCATKYKVLEHVEFNTYVQNLKWDEKNHLWDIVTARGITTFNVVIVASGALHIPSIPPFNGAHTFTGRSIHSSVMTPDLDYTNKTVAVIGSAASAIQLIPVIAKQAKKLYVFQRTPNWIMNKLDYTYSDRIRTLFKYIPVTQQLYRLFLYWTNEYSLLAFRTDLGIGKALRKLLTHQLKQLFDEKTALLLTPDYDLGCKRILLSDKLEFYHALKQDNVCLVTDPIQGLNPSGITTQSEHFKVDDIIYATGFNIGKSLFTAEGKNGETLDKIKEAYLGITVPNFPNFFLILGPNTGLGHNSVVWMIECEVNYIMKCIQHVLITTNHEMDLKKDKAKLWYDRVIATGFEKMAWSGSCKSWYKDENGRIFTLWPGFTFSYWWNVLKAQLSVKDDYNFD